MTDQRHDDGLAKTALRYTNVLMEALPGLLPGHSSSAYLQAASVIGRAISESSAEMYELQLLDILIERDEVPDDLTEEQQRIVDQLRALR